ncbi:MAG: GNAT family N-acetyltransferase [Eubacteriales bacterium]
MDINPTIQTKRLILRSFREDDINDYLNIMSDRHTNVFLPWFPITSMTEAEVHLSKNYLSHYGSPSSCRYAVCLRTDDKPIGYIKINDDESRDLGYGLRHEFWRMGLASEAAIAVIDRAERLGYKYITATHDINNPASGGVMRKAGMTYRYSYVEQWQPKDFPVTFRLYQKNLDGQEDRVYLKYWNTYPEHFVESF